MKYPIIFTPLKQMMRIDISDSTKFSYEDQIVDCPDYEIMICADEILLLKELNGDVILFIKGQDVNYIIAESLKNIKDQIVKVRNQRF